MNNKIDEPLKIYSVVDFGASVSALPAQNAAAIQLALDTCAEEGGGKVIVPPGRYQTGTIRLRSRTELHLEQDAFLIASADFKDYNAEDEYPENFSCVKDEGWSGQHLIIAHNVHDAALTGPGTVDGNGEAFFGEPENLNMPPIWRYGIRWTRPDLSHRPGQLIVFVVSQNVRVTDLKIQHSPCWSLLFHGCDDVLVRGVEVQNGNADANTDGIDIDCCRNVTVSGCRIDTGDDGITVRGGEKFLSKPKASENITVSDCVVACSSSGIRIGVGSGTIRNVEMRNLVFERTGVGITIQSSFSSGDHKGVSISDVKFHNLTFRNTGLPFTIIPGPNESDTTSYIRNITFDSCRFEAFAPGLILGRGVLRPSQIAFDNCEFTIIPNMIPKCVPTTGQAALKISSADQVRFSGCRLNWQTSEPYWEQAVEFDDAPGLVIDGCDFPVPVN